MISTPFKLMAVIALLASALLPAAWGRDLTVTIPMRSKLSPVQRLNREGVEAVKKHQYAKAEALFYKAYLYDPADPFTLNNLGFVSEFQGQLEQAHKFYELAAQQSCSATIDLSSVSGLQNKPMRAALEGLQDLPMRVNRMNVEAMRLLSQDRAFESVTLLEQALVLQPQNPFTLNNLGVADEAIGDYPGALKNYNLAATSHSSEPVMVTQSRAWAGKSVSVMAEASAKRLQKRMQDEKSSETQAAMFNLRGVYAANQNDWSTAEQDFLRAYSLDPADAFSVNNRGYVAEHQGDLESAQFFYEKAKRSGDASDRVGVATERSAEGHSLLNVAEESNRKVDGALDAYSRQRHLETAPVELTPRGAGAAPDFTVPPATKPAAPESGQPATPPQNPQPPQQ
jgi:tetratricopeptide (TPR) repeat protein